MTRRIMHQVRLCCLAVALLALHWTGGGLAVGAAGGMSNCEDVCYIDTACNTECWVYPPDLPGFQTTCGALTDGVCDNTCNVVCGYGVDGSTSCTDNGGSSSTCASYGVYQTCGDGVCTTAEFDSCSSDCGSTPSVSQAQTDELYDLMDDAESAGAFDESFEGMNATNGIYSSEGYLDSGGDVDIGGFNLWLSYGDCLDKLVAVGHLAEMQKRYTMLAKFYRAAAIYAAALWWIYSPAAAAALEAMSWAFEEFADHLNSRRIEEELKPCKPGWMY